MAIYMLKIRRPLGRLIFNMGIAIPGKTVFLIETAPRAWCQARYEMILATSFQFWFHTHALQHADKGNIAATDAILLLGPLLVINWTTILDPYHFIQPVATQFENMLVDEIYQGEIFKRLSMT